MRRMKTLLFFMIFLVLAMQAAFSQTTVRGGIKGTSGAEKEDEFVIKKPGEITFTSGIVIEGRVEKPQVMLVLTKEKIKVEPVIFQQSFVKNITDPLRYNTFEISNGAEEETGEGAERKTRRNQ